MTAANPNRLHWRREPVDHGLSIVSQGCAYNLIQGGKTGVCVAVVRKCPDHFGGEFRDQFYWYTLGAKITYFNSFENQIVYDKCEDAKEACVRYVREQLVSGTNAP